MLRAFLFQILVLHIAKMVVVVLGLTNADVSKVSGDLFVKQVLLTVIT